MDTLIGKLTDLAYEFFGVILPGFFFLLFLTIWWLAVGEMFADRTNGLIPALHLTQIGWIENTFSRTRRIEVGLLLLVLCYFLGQLLNWGSKPKAEKPPKKRTHWLWFLIFRAPRPDKPLSDDLKKLLNEVSKHLSVGQEALAWNQFYRVAKTLIAQNLNYSLVQTYQHKYTLHRCIATMAAVLFWLCTVSALVWLAMHDGPRPNWLLLVVLAVASLWMVNVFSRSYTYFWGVWGETVVTEAYSLFCVSRTEGAIGTEK